MSIHVISAVLNCRDPELSSSRRMVLVCLANYAGDDGHSWPSQQLIADESGCGIRSVKDHLKWLEENGFIVRKTKSLGQGNGSRTSYHILLSRLTKTPSVPGAEFAGANNARAKTSDCEGGILPLTNRQEPSLPIANAIGERASVPRALSSQPNPQKGKGKARGTARGSRISETWTPTVADYAFASKHKLSREEINREADRFRNYWLAASGDKGVKRDWEATWRNWLTGDYGIVTKREQGRATHNRGGADQTLSAFDRVAASLAGHAPRTADPVQPDAGTIEGEYWPAETRTGTSG